MVDALHVTKLDAAGRQLATAIHLYAAEGDPVSIHGLVCAAYDILSDINKARGGAAMLIRDKAIELVKPEQRKGVADAANTARNFFKHADKDPDAVLEFDPGQTDWFLLDACFKYIELTGKRPPLYNVFHVWFHMQYTSVALSPGGDDIMAPLKLAYAGKSRREFFAIAEADVLRRGGTP